MSTVDGDASIEGLVNGILLEVTIRTLISKDVKVERVPPKDIRLTHPK